MKYHVHTASKILAFILASLLYMTQFNSAVFAAQTLKINPSSTVLSKEQIEFLNNALEILESMNNPQTSSNARVFINAANSGRVKFRHLGGDGIGAETGLEGDGNNHVAIEDFKFGEWLQIKKRNSVSKDKKYSNIEYKSNWERYESEYILAMLIIHETKHLTQTNPKLKAEYEDPAWNTKINTVKIHVQNLKIKIDSLLKSGIRNKSDKELLEKYRKMSDVAIADLGTDEEAAKANFKAGILTDRDLLRELQYQISDLRDIRDRIAKILKFPEIVVMGDVYPDPYAPDLPTLIKPVTIPNSKPNTGVQPTPPIPSPPTDSKGSMTTTQSYYFNGTASTEWEGKTEGRLIDLKYKSLKGPRRISWNCEGDKSERSTASLSASLIAHFTTSESFKSVDDIRKALDEAVGKAGGRLVPIALGDFKGFIHTVDKAFKKPSGGCNSGFNSGEISYKGTGYVIKDGVIVKLRYGVYGTGGINGFFQEGSDQPWLEQYAPAIRDEAKAILLGLQLKSTPGFIRTQHQVPVLNVSKLPQVKLMASVSSPYIPGQQVVVSAIVENPEPNNPPVRYNWSGSVNGAAKSLYRVDSPSLDLTKSGRQKVAVEIIGKNSTIGSASHEFDVAEAKVSIGRTDTLPLTTGLRAGLIARLQISGKPVKEGEYIYRWQPHPEVFFSTLDSPRADTQVSFTHAGTYKVWVEILQRQGTVLNTVIASQQLELVVTDALVTPTKTSQIDEPIQQPGKPVTESGYQLYFDGKLVSGPDAASYTLLQAKKNCTYNLNTKPNIAIKCVFNGLVFEPPQHQPRKPVTDSGYQLYFDGKLVSGPDAASYTLLQAKQNCTYNLNTKPNIAIKCVFNGLVFEPQQHQPVQAGLAGLWDTNIPGTVHVQLDFVYAGGEWNIRFYGRKGWEKMADVRVNPATGQFSFRRPLATWGETDQTYSGSLSGNTMTGGMSFTSARWTGTHTSGARGKKGSD